MVLLRPRWYVSIKISVRICLIECTVCSCSFLQTVQVWSQSDSHVLLPRPSLVQYILSRILVVRPRQYVANIQHHY
jgi:hypothetical protein